MVDVGTLFVALAVIVAGAGLARGLFARLGLPGVVGEILLGILLGPSLLGWAAPGLSGSLFPAANQPTIEALSWIGLALFVLQVGLEMRWQPDAVSPIVRTAMGGLVLPLAAGMALAIAAPSWFFPGPAAFGGILLVGVALTVSALPVLARILEDFGLLGSRLGTVALGAATLDDIFGWVLLALISVAGSGAAAWGFAAGLLLALVVGAALVASERIARPRLEALAQPSPPLFVGVMALVFAAAALTEATGLNAVLGPLAVGALLSRHAVIRDDLKERLGQATRVVLLPVFFVASGAAVDVRLLPMPASLLALVAVLLVASLAKVAGTAAGARAAGLGWREGLGVGCLLNARGAVGLVVVKVGMDAGLLSGQGYALLVVVVALTTTAAPLLARLALRPIAAARALKEPS